jgi:hypothetical protein
MKIDPGMHIGLHLVFFGKTGVTVAPAFSDDEAEDEPHQSGYPLVIGMIVPKEGNALDYGLLNLTLALLNCLVAATTFLGLVATAEWLELPETEEKLLRWLPLRLCLLKLLN